MRIDFQSLPGWRFQQGGEVTGAYDTPLSLWDEAAFQSWKSAVAPHDSGEDYDLRGAFKAGLLPDPETGHWSDLFKKPNHPTFSDESIYSIGRGGIHWGDPEVMIPDTGAAKYWYVDPRALANYDPMAQVWDEQGHEFLNSNVQ